MSNLPIHNEEIDETRALSRLGLTENEIRAYFSVAGKGVCLATEIGKHAGIAEGDYDGAMRVTNNLIKAGLLMEIPGRTIRYQAVPPYAAMLKQLEEFRATITDLRKSVPSQLQKEFDEFEAGFRKVSGLQDFKDFVVSIEQDIPNAMLEKFSGFAEKFKSFKQLEEFKTYIEKMRESAPQELAQKFAALENQFDKLSNMDEFRRFVSTIRERAIKELTQRFEHLETGIGEIQKLDQISAQFKDINEKVPPQLKKSFTMFQEEFRKVAGLEGFKQYVSAVKQSLPQKIESEFASIERNFSQLRQLQEFSAFVENITNTIPQQTMTDFMRFESEFKNLSGLNEMKLFMMDLRDNIPKELAGQFERFERTLTNVKSDLIKTTKQNFGNWFRLYEDIFNPFINAFISETLSDELEKIRQMFMSDVVDGVEQIISKVMIKTDSVSTAVLNSFTRLRDWLLSEVVNGLTNTLQSINAKVSQASYGVTQGFNQLKAWITNEVTVDLANSLSEVETGAIQASSDVVNRIAELGNWFEETVVKQLSTILTGMQVKLKTAVEDARRELGNIKGWFVKDAIEGISKTLEATQSSVEQVSAEVNKSLKTLREWFQGEAINQLGVALLEIEMKVGDASQDVVNGFNEMQKWVSNDVIITIKNTLESVTKKVSYASDAINQEVANLREIFSKRVVGNTFEMLSRIEDQLWDSEATMKAFWDRALESGQRFEEVFFVQGADAMIGEIAMISERVKSKIFIVAPEIEDIDIIPLKTLSSRINIRLCAAINPESKRAMQIVNEFINLSNVQIRNYDGRDVWGVSKDFEEIIVGAVSGLNVAGIGSILDQHIKYLNPVLEECWLKGKQVKSLEDLKGVAPAPKKEMKELPKDKPKAAISVSTEDMGQVKIEKPSTTQKMVINPEMATDIKEKYNTIKGGLASLPKEYIGKALEELKEYIVSKYGFNRLVFEFSKKARLIAKKPQEYMSEQEIKELNDEVESWLQKM